MKTGIRAAAFISKDLRWGELVEHRYTRTVTQMDNMLFSNMTLNQRVADSSPAAPTKLFKYLAET